MLNSLKLALRRLNSIYTRIEKVLFEDISASSQTCFEIPCPLYLLISFMSVAMLYLSHIKDSFGDS